MSRNRHARHRRRRRRSPGSFPAEAYNNTAACGERYASAFLTGDRDPAVATPDLTRQRIAAMGHYLDVDAWSRREHFHLFRRAEQPFFSVTTEVDVTAFSSRGASF